MHSQSWMATLVITVIAFGGGLLTGMHGSPAPVVGQPIVAKASSPDVSAYFTPKGGCTAAILDEIGSARQTVEVQCRAITSPLIADALVVARQRGVRVTVVLDAAQTSGHREQARYLAGERVPVLLDAKHGLTDNRVILIDNRIVIAGSFDLSATAEEGNANNILILRDQPRIQSAYEDNFRAHVGHAQGYDGG